MPPARSISTVSTAATLPSSHTNRNTEHCFRLTSNAGPPYPGGRSRQVVGPDRGHQTRHAESHLTTGSGCARTGVDLNAPSQPQRHNGGRGTGPPR